MFWILRKKTTGALNIYEKPQILVNLGIHLGLGVKQSSDIPVIPIINKKGNKGKITDNLIAYGANGLVLNSRVRGIFEQHGVKNIDYYDVQFTDRENQVSSDDYKIANIIGLVSCIDREKSTLRIDNGSVEAIDKLVLDYKKIEESGLKIFKIKEIFPVILIDDDVKKDLEKTKVTGFRFVDPEDFVL